VRPLRQAVLPASQVKPCVLQVLDGGTPVAIAGSKRRAALALLLLHANEVVRTERLIDELWGEHAPRNASAALHSHVSRLRKALGPEVLARREWGYVLRADPDSIDLDRFERLVTAAEPLPARERSAKLSEALQLWRGPALADLASESGLQAEIARLDELRLTTLERRIDADLEAGRNAEIVGEIEALIAAHPLREHLRSQLILALYRAGRQAEALEVYRETRRVLSEELGLEPSPELRELERAILRQDPTIGPVPAPAHPATTGRRHTSGPPPKPVTISDSFAGDYVDPTIWHAVKDGGDVSIVEQGGQLQLTVGADAVPGGAYNQIDVHVGTHCSFPGNFSARVDYTLLEWPPGDNIDIGLNAIYANGAVTRDSSSQSGDEYSSGLSRTPTISLSPTPAVRSASRASTASRRRTSGIEAAGGNSPQLPRPEPPSSDSRRFRMGITPSAAKSSRSPSTTSRSQGSGPSAAPEADRLPRRPWRVTLDTQRSPTCRE
jgi:DNA-binding SARP family transcriptional activator